MEEVSVIVVRVEMKKVRKVKFNRLSHLKKKRCKILLTFRLKTKFSYSEKVIIDHN